MLMISAVTVNTRALIDKVLARYSGEYTTIRELIQNAADAAATKVVIRFETLPSKDVPVPQTSDSPTLLNHTISHHTLHRLVVSNDGDHFGDADWSRLKRIAEGNPDETKIGAFGVGFYSVFDECESPFVVSGRKSMAFVWKGNSLYTKTGTLPEGQQRQETSFLLNYRAKTTPIPDLMSISQFLCTSLTFVGLQHIELWLDQWNILLLEKKSSPSLDAKLPSDIQPTTREGLMKIASVAHQSTQIDARWLNIVCKPKVTAVTAKVEESPALAFKSFFSKIASHATMSNAARQAQRDKELAEAREIHENLDKPSKGTVFLRTTTAQIKCSVSSTFASELERATKKPPPRTTRIAVLTASRDDLAAAASATSGVTGYKAEDLFSSVVPSKAGRIFIGFPTAQTTGLLCHISAPSVIPTVERESIDLNARHVKTWNTELLRVAGVVARIAYVGSMASLENRLRGTVNAAGRDAPSEDDIAGAIPEAAHIFKQFLALESTPLPAVGALIEEAFWSCSRKFHIDILSTKGVLPSSKVRIVPEPLRFLQNVAAVPSSLLKTSESFLRRLFERGLISDITILDVRRELDDQALALPNMIKFLSWLTSQTSSSSMDIATAKSLLNAAIGTYDEGGRGRMIALSQIQTYIAGNRIPGSMPVPPTTIPFIMSRALSPAELSSLGWEELQVVPWLRYLIEGPARGELSEEQDITKSASFAKSVHHVLSKQWDQINQASRELIVELLSTRRVMPTKMGMKLPSEAYFASVKLFELPTITLDHTVKEKYLTAIGVRKTIEINVVLDLLTNPNSTVKWSFTDLVRYLISVQSDIPPKDIERLRSGAFCPQLDPKTGEERQGILVPIHALYEPTPELEPLGLPTLYWPDRYRSASQEGRFLKFLGLKSHPQYGELAKMLAEAGADPKGERYDIVLQYLLQNYDKNGYGGVSKDSTQNLPFLPIEGNQSHLVTPKSCYANESAAILGYPILKASLQSHAAKFGVKRDPAMKECVECLIGNPPASHEDASKVFSYFAGRLGEITKDMSNRLGSANIVPVTKNGKIKLTAPKMCFLGDSSTYQEILDFVDFGQQANAFLLCLGSKNEPTATELAQIVKDSPANVLNAIGVTRYTDLLRRLAEQAAVLRRDLVLWKSLREVPFLLARRTTTQVRTKARDSKTDEKLLLEDLDDIDDDQLVDDISLRKASKIVVVDSDREYLMFRAHLHTAPPDEALEKFYLALGSLSLKSLLVLDERIGNPRREQGPALALRKLLVERARLFLHEHTQERRHDAKWLESNLTVTLVDSLSVHTSLKGFNVQGHHEKKSAVLSERRRSFTLFITSRPDLFEVSRCIIGLLLAKPRHNDVLALEMVLSSDLRALRVKGYNVERILQRQARETRLADEQRQRQQAEEERVAAENQRLLQNDTQNGALVAPPPYAAPEPAQDHEPMPPPMPGAFEPEPHGGQHNALKNRGKELLSHFAQWGRHLSAAGAPGPHDSSGHGAGPADQLPTQHAPGVPEPLPPSAANDPAAGDRDLTRNLASAIGSCRPHNSTIVYNPPSTTAVQAAAASSYCDARPAQDLVEVGKSHGIRLFVARSLRRPDGRISFLEPPRRAENEAGCAVFGRLLAHLAGVFGMNPAAVVHIFVDERGSSIAFNASGALFFNYHYFRSLHLPAIMGARSDSEKRAAHLAAVSYWWITMCHELAHNMVSEHSAAHSFYTESFATEYFVGAMKIVAEYRPSDEVGGKAMKLLDVD
jgi:hypothetical protein